MLKRYNYYEVTGEKRIFRQVINNTKDIKERKPIEEYKNGKWYKTAWEEWKDLTLSFLTDDGAKKLMKQIA